MGYAMLGEGYKVEIKSNAVIVFITTPIAATMMMVNELTSKVIVNRFKASHATILILMSNILLALFDIHVMCTIIYTDKMK